MRGASWRRRTAGGAVFLAGCVVLASCGTAPSTGTVTGIAAPCMGIGDAPITVYAAREGQITASQKVLPVKGAGRYRLRLPAGTYVINAPGSGIPPRSVILGARETVTVNFLDHCK